MTPQERIRAYHDATTGARELGNPLDGFYIVESEYAPQGTWGYAVGSTLYIHPRDLAMLCARVWARNEASTIVRTGLFDVIHWLKKAGVTV